MKKILSIYTVLLSVLLFSPDLSVAETGKSFSSDFLSSLPEVKKNRMKNEINFYYLENDLPVTVIYVSISFGKLYENSSNAGITEVLNKALTIGGSAAYPGNKLNEELESVGGQIQISAGWENIGIEIKVLSKYSSLAFKILGDILKNPVFDEAGVKLSKKLVIEKVRRDMDEPEEAGVLKLREIIFGGSGYGSVPTEKSIGGVDTEILKELWKKFVTGGNINIAVSSSIGEREIITLAGSELSEIVSGKRQYYSVDREKVLADIKSSSGVIYLIPSELEQATIYTGTLAPDIKYSGDYALYIVNYILGGGSFNSRLMNEIRVKRGLAYSVYSLIRNRRNTGVFISFAQTKNESVTEVLSLIRDNINKMCNEPVTKEELEWAKESIKNSYVFKFNNIDDLLANFFEIEYNDLDTEYFKNYLDNINSVTQLDVTGESSKIFKQGLVTVVVGSRKLEKELSMMGKVVVCDRVQ